MFDTLVQPPVDDHRPDNKKVDVEVDTIKFPEKKSGGKKKSALALIKEMSIGKLSTREQKSLYNMINTNIDAFSRSESDNGKFTGFAKPYKLPLKRGCIPQ